LRFGERWRRRHGGGSLAALFDQLLEVHDLPIHVVPVSSLGRSLQIAAIEVNGLLRLII